MKLLLIAFISVLNSLVYAKGLDSIVEKLDSVDFAEREKARVALSEYIKDQRRNDFPLVLSRYARSTSPEVRASIKKQLMPRLFSKGYLGITHEGRIFNFNRFDRKKAAGTRVARVNKDTPAEKAGLRVGDVILAIAGKWFQVPDEKEFTQTQSAKLVQDQFSRAIKSHRAGSTVEITYLRNGKVLYTKATLFSYNKVYNIKGFTDYEYQQFYKMWQRFRR